MIASCTLASSRFGTLAEFGTLVEFCTVAVVELASSINIPQWHLTKVNSRIIGNKNKRNLQKQVKITLHQHGRSEPCGLDATISPRYDWSVARQSTSLYSTTSLESQGSYLTTGILPYEHISRSLEIFSACTMLSHNSIMLPPRQPRVFARLARWQLWSASPQLN